MIRREVEARHRSWTNARGRELQARRRVLILPLLLLPVVSCAVPRQHPSFTYRAAITTGDTTGIAVTLRVRGAPRDSLVLRAFAPQEVLRLSGLEARGEDGRQLIIRNGVVAISVDGHGLNLPRFTLRGPLPDVVTVRYRVSPGARDGSAHTGIAGFEVQRRKLRSVPGGHSHHAHPTGPRPLRRLPRCSERFRLGSSARSDPLR